jgi:hypothetical protein
LRPSRAQSTPATRPEQKSQMALVHLKKLRNKYIWKRIFYERLTEPLHLNLIALPVALFGGFRSRVAFDLVIRQNHAYAILACADLARELGIREVTLIEFGVAAGAGILNICKLSERVTRETGVRFRIFGFDTGKGMPPPQSYRDHPEIYQEGDFPMSHDALQRTLPDNAKLILGELTDTVGPFLRSIPVTAPIGFVSIDVDYYSSTRDSLAVLEGAGGQYLPRVLIYLDDLEHPSHNSWCGERRAVLEFNERHEMRKIEQHAFLRSYRIFRNARWIDHMFTLHVLDHPSRITLVQDRRPTILTNPYLGERRQ